MIAILNILLPSPTTPPQEEIVPSIAVDLVHSWKEARACSSYFAFLNQKPSVSYHDPRNYFLNACLILLYSQLCSIGASLVVQLVKNSSAMQETGFSPSVEKIPWRREKLPTPVFWPGEVLGLYSPRCRKESDMTE